MNILSRIPALGAWYDGVRRDFPWRKTTPEPYEVWISEIMSHQSTMATVLPYFQRWMQKFPTLPALAAAPEAEVLAAWAGLGYYSRARNVLKAARELARGEWPRRATEWRQLPGVGPYSAAAIASICFGDPVLPLDGNVLRVLSRIYAIPNPLNDASERKVLESRLAELAASLPAGSHGKIGQALMELGAVLCKPGPAAKCELCPLRLACISAKRGVVASLPKPKKRPELLNITSLALVYRNARGALLLRRIPEGRRLASQWELPLWELGAEFAGELTQIRRKFEVSARPVKHLITKHAYTVHRVEAGRWEGKIPEDHAFWTPSEPVPGTLTTLTRKILLI